MSLDISNWMQEMQSFLGCPLVDMQRSDLPPPRPYAAYSFLAEQGVPAGTNCVDDEGPFWQDSRKISLQFFADTNDSAASLASKAQQWLLFDGYDITKNAHLCVGKISSLQLRAHLFGNAHEYRAMFEVDLLFLRQIDSLQETEWIEDVQFQ